MADAEKEPLMYSPDYERFADFVLEHVVLSILYKAVLRDMRQLSEEMKFFRVYRLLLERVQEVVEREQQRVREALRQTAGIIIGEKQDSVAREVTVRFRGFTYSLRFQNSWLRHQCEARLMLFLSREVVEILKERGLRGAV